MFAVLAANRVKINPIPVTTLPTAQSVSSSSSSHVKRWLVIFISTFLSALGLVLVFLAYYFMRRRRAKAAQRRRQTFVRLQDLPRSATPRRTEGVVLSPLPNFDDVDFKAPVDADTESLSEAIARKGFMEQQRAMEHEGANPPSYVDVPDAKTDGGHQ
ncbi:hypothetical protein SCHPADRAFT_234334 [Schizopora paradoxa]|uniref:Uncharacterized protein n=1 Tax=Schizopora paradoxa TaxID=27342 RepID=A0A0H2RVM0_9AGAM|nr:hypothetical protein SCHPADRAFT_234334 [Schizopora paradoxa]